MTEYDVIERRGIGESDNPTKMTTNLTRRLGARFHTRREFHWSAQFTGPDSYDGIRKLAALNLADEIRGAERPVVLHGFSAGAHTIGDALLMLDGDDRRKVAYTILCADPAMPKSIGVYRDQSVTGTRRVDGYGITGSRPIWMPSPVVWVSSAGDAICQARDRSPIRSIADWLCVTEPRLDETNAALYAKLRENRFQNVDLSPMSVWNAAVDLDGYLRRGEHVNPYPLMLSDLGARLDRALP